MYRIDTLGTRGLIYFCKFSATSDWIKVEKKANIKNRYNEVPHLTLDTIWESDKTQENVTNKMFVIGNMKLVSFSLFLDALPP